MLNKACECHMLLCMDHHILFEVPPMGFFVLGHAGQFLFSLCDRIPSNTPGAEPPRDARDSGSARSHSTHLETSSSDRP